jgi:hypothetical protein
MWWKGVFAGVFANCGAQNVVFFVVTVVQTWWFVWLKLQKNGAETMGQVFAIYFRAMEEDGQPREDFGRVTPAARGEVSSGGGGSKN